MARNKELYPTDFPEITPSPQAVLRSHLPDVGDLGVQETDPGMGGPEALGTYTQEDVGAPVSDEQAQRWMEETQIESARIELEMLRDKMLNSRRDLIDDLYGGDDPSLRNTKPIIDELRKMELKTFMGSIGDPEEMTPQQKLQVAIAKVNISKGITATVQGEKQKDMETLNDAVSKYNAGIATQMGGIQTGAQTLQTIHAEQDKATAEAEAEAKEATWMEKTLFKESLIRGRKALPQKLSRADISAIFKAEQDLGEIPDHESSQFKHALKAVNAMRAAVGLRPLKKTVIVKGEKKRFWFDVKEKAKYTATYEQEEGNIRRYNPATGKLE